MANLRPLLMLLIGIVAVFAFFVQSSSCLVERAGVLPCHEHVAEDSCADSHQGEDVDCCHVESTAFLAQPISPAPAPLKKLSYFAPAIGAPEAPVEEVDYPPQRLS